MPEPMASLRNPTISATRETSIPAFARLAKPRLKYLKRILTIRAIREKGINSQFNHPSKGKKATMVSSMAMRERINDIKPIIVFSPLLIYTQFDVLPLTYNNP